MAVGTLKIQWLMDALVGVGQADSSEPGCCFADILNGQLGVACTVGTPGLSVQDVHGLSTELMSIGTLNASLVLWLMYSSLMHSPPIVAASLLNTSSHSSFVLCMVAMVPKSEGITCAHELKTTAVVDRGGEPNFGVI